MDDDTAITALIKHHFEPMRWDANSAPDWDRARQDFLPDALFCGPLVHR